MEKLSFYNNKEGYAAFSSWIGFTEDSGHSFQKKYITISNVDYNNHYPVNLTFGFAIKGVYAFDRNGIIVYGHYGFVPAINFHSCFYTHCAY